MAILETLWQLVGNLGTLAYELLAIGWHYILLIVWVAWWLLGVNWNRAWVFLRQGAWAPLLLVMVLGALVWSQIAPSRCNCLGFVSIPNFWWQLGYVGLLGAVMLVCGWLQGTFHLAPAEIELDPPAHGHGHGHEGHGSPH
jgi:hypothetical protein